MKRALKSIGCVLLLLLVALPAHADSISQSFSLTTSASYTPIALLPFNTSLGQLDAVDIYLSVTIFGIEDTSVLNALYESGVFPPASLLEIWQIANLLGPGGTPDPFIRLPFPIRTAYAEVVMSDTIGFAATYGVHFGFPSVGAAPPLT